MTTSANFPGLLESFFTDRLMHQRQSSPNTIASYRDTFRLFLKYVQSRLKKSPSELLLADLDAPLVGTFLDHLEKERAISARSRNVRLAAIHSFFKYAAFHQPDHSALIQRVLAIPGKRYDKFQIEFLNHTEINALVSSPNAHTWIGRRDRTLMLLAVQTGLRVSELVGLCCRDVVLGSGAHIRCLGKGRKSRCTPLRKEMVKLLRAWLKEQRGQEGDPLFPNTRGSALSRDSVAHLLAKHARAASARCPSLKGKRISPHVLRHSTAMNLLQNGVDRSVIALWLGHESMETTQIYLHANLALKEEALSKTAPTGVRPGRYKPEDRLLAFLKSL
jgi:integrase/recombinase XerD